MVLTKSLETRVFHGQKARRAAEHGAQEPPLLSQFVTLKILARNETGLEWRTIHTLRIAFVAQQRSRHFCSFDDFSFLTKLTSMDLSISATQNFAPSKPLPKNEQKLHPGLSFISSPCSSVCLEDTANVPLIFTGPNPRFGECSIPLAVQMTCLDDIKHSGTA